MTQRRPRSSNSMATGWATIGSLAKREALRPSGTVTCEMASAGAEPWGRQLIGEKRQMKSKKETKLSLDFTGTILSNRGGKRHPKRSVLLCSKLAFEKALPLPLSMLRMRRVQ